MFFYNFYGLKPLPEVYCILCKGRVAEFEPELVQLAALPRFQCAIPALKSYSFPPYVSRGYLLAE
jgi:hypothetical protein